MFVRSETLRLAQYLATLRVLPRDGGPVQVLVVAPPGQRAAFEQVLQSDARLVFRTVDSAEAEARRRPAAQARRAPPARRSTCTSRRSSRRASSSPRAAERRRYLVWQLQRAVVAAGAIGFAACALFAGARWLDVVQARGTRRAAGRRRRGAPPRPTRASPPASR